MTQLTPHFTLEELTYTDHRELDNTPNDAELENLKRLAAFLEEVKTVLGGKPVMVNSAFRSKDVNDAVVKYGKLGALLTILEARETSKIKIELKKKQLLKRFSNNERTNIS